MLDLDGQTDGQRDRISLCDAYGAQCGAEHRPVSVEVTDCKLVAEPRGDLLSSERELELEFMTSLNIQQHLTEVVHLPRSTCHVRHVTLDHVTHADRHPCSDTASVRSIEKK